MRSIKRIALVSIGLSAACGGTLQGAPTVDEDAATPHADGAIGRRNDGGVGRSDGSRPTNDARVFPGEDGGPPRTDGEAPPHEDSGRPPQGDAGGPPREDGGGPPPNIDAGGCTVGFHVCSGQCVDDTAPATCGSSCTPCATPANGVASCNGSSCYTTCDPGYTTCASGCCSCGDIETDPSNCGYCGHSCGTQACVDGVCGSTVIATGQANAYALAADNNNVYWTTIGTGSSVNQAPVGGGGETVLLNSQNEYPAALALVSGQVYWTDELQAGTVSRIPIGGGSSLPVASNLAYPGALVANGTTLFFTTNTFASESAGAVMSVSASGGSPTTVASGQSFAENEYTSIAVGGSNVYWTTYASVMAAPANGGQGATTFSSNTYPVAVAADATNVYWTSIANGEVNASVYQQPQVGGSIITLASGQYYPNAITVDGANVYWTCGAGGTGTVVSAPIGGGTPVTIAMGQAEPAAVALNSTTVFWVNYGDGSIHSVPK